MEITPLGTNRSQITVVFDPSSAVFQPRIIDKTRWLLLDPALLPTLQTHLLALGWRAAEISASTWSTIVHQPYLLEAYPITRRDPITIFPFGSFRNRVNLLRVPGSDIQLSRVGSAKIITADHESIDWLRQFITSSPRGTQPAISYFKSAGLTLTSTIMREQF